MSAGMPGMTTRNPARRQPAPAQQSVPSQGLDCILRTGRIKAATTTEQRADRILVNAQHSDHRPGQEFPRLHALPPARREIRTSISRRTPRLNSAAVKLGFRPSRKTMSANGRLAAFRRNASRAWRFTALRIDARRNNLLGTTRPSLAGVSASAGGEVPTSKSNHAPRNTRRRANTAANSVGRRSRCAGRNLADRVGLTRSDREAVTTLGPARADHRAATTGAHAYEEAMGALATHDGRLVSTFHDLVPKKKGKPWITAF